MTTAGFWTTDLVKSYNMEHFQTAGNGGDKSAWIVPGGVGWRMEDMQLEELADVWEASVRFSHHFLSEDDIAFYRPLVRNEYLYAVDIYVSLREDGGVAAFMGISGDMIEMLFVHPDDQGKGYGTILIDFAVSKLGIRKVDVNEQNTKALNFYLSKGFAVTGRDEKDAQGRDFPILHLALPSSTKGII